MRNITNITKGLATVALTSTVACFWARPAAALTVTTVSQATLPDGSIIVVQQITLDSGDTVPWHYHSGPGWGSIVAGTLTEEEGCGTPVKTIAAGAAFAEIPGKVHRVFNFGSTPVVFTWVEIYPGCDPNGGITFVDGPRCEGQSGRSHLEPVPKCPGEDGDSQ